MNLEMYINFVAPIILARKFGISTEEADELIKNNISEEYKDLIK